MTVLIYILLGILFRTGDANALDQRQPDEKYAHTADIGLHRVARNATATESPFEAASQQILNAAKDSNTFSGSHDFLTKSQIVLNNLKPLMMEATNAKDRGRIFRRELLEINIYLPRSIANDISDDWATEYERLVQSTDALKDWYGFLSLFYHYASSGNLIIASVKNGTGEISLITKDSFSSFFDNIAGWNTDFVKYQTLKGKELNENQVNELNQILQETVTKKVKEFQPSLLSDEDPTICILHENYITNSIIAAQCKTKSSIYFFAKEIINMAENIELRDRSLILVAPSVVVVGNVTVKLTGSVGKSSDASNGDRMDSKSRCPTNKEETSSGFSDEYYLKHKCVGGVKGKVSPACNGKPSSHFVVIAKLIKQSQNLIVQSVGGDGGLGADGKDEMTFKTKYEFVDRGFLRSDHYITHLTVGRGGDGGQGGWGGNPGHVYIFGGGSEKVTVAQTKGVNGLGGFGGRGGWAHGNPDLQCCIRYKGNGFITRGYYMDIGNSVHPCQSKPRCFCKSAPNSKPTCFLREHIFNMSPKNEKRAYPLVEKSVEKADCCVVPPERDFDGKLFRGPRTGDPPPPHIPIAISNFITDYQTSVLPNIDHRNANTREFLSFLSSSPAMEGSHYALSLSKEMGILSNLRGQLTVDKEDSLIPTYQEFIQKIQRHSKLHVFKKLSTTCASCKQNGDTNFNDNCNAVLLPQSGLLEKGTGPTCTTAFVKDDKYSFTDSKKRLMEVMLGAALGPGKSWRKEPDVLIFDMGVWLNEMKKYISISDKVLVKAVSAMKDRIDDNINDTATILTDKVLPELKTTHVEYDNEFLKVVGDATRKLEETRKDKKQAKESKNRLHSAIGLKITAELMQIFGGFAKLMGPEGIVAYEAIGAFAGLLRTATKEADPTGYLKGKWEGAKASATPITNYLNKLQENKWPLLKAELQKLENETQKLPDSNMKEKAELTQYVKNFQKSCNVATTSVLDNHLLNGILTKVTQIIVNLKSVGRRKRDAKDIIAAIKNIGNAINLIKIGAEGSVAVFEVISETDLAEEAAKTLADLATYYDEMISIISNFLTPMVSQLFLKLETWTGGSSPGRSFLLLDFKSVRILEGIAKMRREIPQFEAGLTGKKSRISELAENLASNVKLVLKTHERVEGYLEKLAYLEFQTAINESMASCAIPSPNTPPDDLLPDAEDYEEQMKIWKEEKELGDACHNNLLLIWQNNFDWMYRRQLNAFTWGVFPLGHYYTKFLKTSTGIGLVKDQQAMANVVTNKIEELRTVMHPKNRETRDLRDKIGYLDDKCDHQFLFMWTSEELKDKISSIFSNKAVLVHAPIYKSPLKVGFDALKFKAMYLQFIPRNASMLEHLTSTLSHFHVEMTHTGISQFVVGDHYYSFANPSLRITYRYGQDEAGRMRNSNGVYQKVSGNPDWILSPFTTWQIELDDNFNSGFGILEPFKNLEIDVKLCGRAQYYKDGYLDIIGKEDTARFYGKNIDKDLARDAFEYGN